MARMDKSSDGVRVALARIEAARASRASKLVLSDLNLSEIPESIGQLRKLKLLDLARNRLWKVPKSIGQLTQLELLDISENRLREVPESIGQLAQLAALHLADNQLSRLPDSIGGLIQLLELNIRDNQLKELPESIGRLIQLGALNLRGNQLREVPESVGQLTQLAALYLSDNQLSGLPDSIGGLTQLEVLNLADNRLVALPDIIGELTRLRELNLSHNELAALPKSIGKLIQLETLNLLGNRLTTLPESIGQLARVKLLDLSHNQLTELPDTLQNAKQLTRLYLHGNERLGLPVEVVGLARHDLVAQRKPPTNPAEILEYYFRIRREKRPLNEAKLILIGRGGVGKTSLVNRLVHQRFDALERKTEGIHITDWLIRLHGLEDVRLNVWDFGGQEIMHATHQFFLTQRSLYLLVLNGREGGEDTDAEYWLRLIDSFGGDSPVIVVLNKIREHPFDLNRRALEKKYPIRDFIRTDCEDGAGIEELRRAIERETDRLEHLRDAFPASWFTIKERLASMQQNYLSFKEYRSFCEENGETDSVAQEALAGYLHHLGIALNYKDDPRLQHTHVLNPHWVTNGIYRILNSPRLEAQKGEIRLEDLREVLDENDYPPEMQRFVIDLMKKFELCFSFPDDDTHYLIPELLDKQEPEKTAEFIPEECLNFQYHYPVLPEGLLPRFIVRTHVLSEGLPRWRSGVILRFEGNHALVKADVPERTVFISVTGPLFGRRRLLAVIRSDFERIHGDIRNLQPQEIIPVPGHPDVVVSYKKLLVLERQGVRTLIEVIGEQTVELDVHDLLNGVDIDGTRARDRDMDAKGGTVRLFYSYSHRDEGLRNELDTHLKLLQRQGTIMTWHDRNIDAGDDWKQKIDDNLERAHIILLLVSADFIASDYCYEKETERALERHDNGEARVIPVIVRDVNWRRAPFAKLQALPKDGKAVTLWPDRDSAWRNVSEGIEKVVEQLAR